MFDLNSYWITNLSSILTLTSLFLLSNKHKMFGKWQATLDEALLDRSKKEGKARKSRNVTRKGVLGVSFPLERSLGKQFLKEFSKVCCICKQTARNAFSRTKAIFRWIRFRCHRCSLQPRSLKNKSGYSCCYSYASVLAGTLRAEPPFVFFFTEEEKRRLCPNRVNSLKPPQPELLD